VEKYFSGADDVDDSATTARTELDIASSECEQRVIATATNVVAGVEVRATLTDDDLASIDELTTKALHA
jgi:hypothetical protein